MLLPARCDYKSVFWQLALGSRFRGSLFQFDYQEVDFRVADIFSGMGFSRYPKHFTGLTFAYCCPAIYSNVLNSIRAQRVDEVIWVRV